MSRRRSHILKALAHRLVTSRLGYWYFSRTQQHTDRLLLRLTRGKVSLTGMLPGVELVLVTTTGARTGLPRPVPLLAIPSTPESDCFALVASNWGRPHHPAWYLNLKAEPRARCARNGQVRECVAHEAEGDAYALFWERAVETYPGYEQYRRRTGGRRIPIVIMTSVQNQEIRAGEGRNQE